VKRSTMYIIVAILAIFIFSIIGVRCQLRITSSNNEGIEITRDGLDVMDVAYADNEPQQSHTTLLIEVVNGRHGSIWKFRDHNRECYFNSSGGIWCTP